MNIRFALASFLVAVCAGSSTAQLFPVGYRDVAFVNRTSQGSATIPSRVFYPALAAGPGTALRPHSGGYPVVVFLHGLSAVGSNYGPIATYLAERGNIAVMIETGRFSAPVLSADGIAMFATLRAENISSTSFFRGALDMNRAGVAGHSMGGGCTVRVLASDPGYRSGFCFAPWEVTADGQGRFYPELYGPLVRVPVAIVNGTGDTVIGWRRGAQAFFDYMTNYTGFKSFCLLNQDCDHNNVVFPGGSATDQAVYARCASMCAGFFAHTLDGRTDGLEAVVGAPVASDPRLVRLRSRIEQTELWFIGDRSLGGTFGLETFAANGPAALLAAGGTGSLDTPFGELLLDVNSMFVVNSGVVDSSHRLSTSVTVPNQPSLVGVTVPFQGVGVDRTGSLCLTRTAVAVTVVP